MGTEIERENFKVSFSTEIRQGYSTIAQKHEMFSHGDAVSGAVIYELFKIKHDL